MTLCRAHRLLSSIPHIRDARTFASISSFHPHLLMPGQNLSERHRRFERPLGEKRETDDVNFPTSATSTESFTSASAGQTNMFHGFRIPKEPQPPSDDECCMSNCAVCVYDLYDDDLEAYRASVAELRSSLSALDIPEVKWPASIRPSKNKQPTVSRKDVVLSAFEEMERALKEKRQASH